MKKRDNTYFVYLVSKKLHETGWRIVMHYGSSHINPELKIVCINKRHSSDMTLVTLLHEFGHVELWNSKNYRIKYNVGYIQENNPKVNKTSIHKLKVLEEEIEAWNIGENFASKHDMFVNKDPKFKKYFQTQRTKCLMTYIHWVSKKK